jgi:hypothetical protein
MRDIPGDKSKQQQIEQLQAWVSALVAEERTEKPTTADIITAFTDLIEYIEADDEY